VEAMLVDWRPEAGNDVADIAADPILNRPGHAVERAGPDLTATIKANAKVQANLLRRGSPVIAELAGQGKLKVIAAYYDLASGKVTVLG
jgi:carbonic anhydrase